jgi:hypothetical protein
MMHQEHKRPVNLEDLLRLKRAERPPAEFWSQFDRELRAKQLAALVEKRPWWRTLPHAFGGLARYHLPLGATAVLAITVLTALTVREYRSAVPPHAVSDAAQNIAMAVTVPEAATSKVAFVRGAAPVREESVAYASENEPASDSVNAGSTSVALIPGQLAQSIPVLGAVPNAANLEQHATPTARFIAANLALAKAAEPAIAQNLLGASHGFESRAMPARPPAVEPLAQMTSPSDARRARLLNGAVMSVSMNSVPPPRTTELRARQLSDEQLYDTISRFGARGNSLLVKF